MKGTGIRGSLRAIVACLAPLVAVVMTSGCGPTRPDRVEIMAFEPASGAYRPGDEAVSSLRLRNITREERTFWIGYSVQDEGGIWHDVPARPVHLQGGESTLETLSWNVPERPPPPSGSYKVAIAVWNESPANGSEEARLAGVEQDNAFRVTGLREDFGFLDGNRWRVSSKGLGRGRLEPGNVRVESGRLWLKIPADTFDGGEIESRKLRQYGSYRARVKVADAPSSLTGFFLYRTPDLENELDVEIFNDSSGRIMFTTYAGGKETNNVEKNLSFDPTGDFHEYRFDFYPGKVEFYVDGALLHSFDKGLPEESMKLYVNSWFPTWLSGKKPATDSYTYVDWIQH